MPMPALPPVTLLVVDDHNLFRRGLVALLGQDPGLKVVGEAGDAALPKELYGLLLKVHQHFAKTPELSEWLPDAGKLVETLDRPLLVTVMGEFNSGKSTGPTGKFTERMS